MELRNHMVSLRLTEEEAALIQSRMEQAGIRSMSAYLRKIAIDGYVIQMELSDMKEVLRLLKINSNNLNQYAKKANETGSIYREDVQDLKRTQKEILERMGNVLDKLSGIM